MNALTPLPADGDVVDLLLPPDIAPDSVRPLPGGSTLRMGGSTMGTEWSLRAVAERAEGEAIVRAVLEQAFEWVILQMSQWEPNSELNHFNRGEPGSAHAISPHFRAVLECALEIAQMTGGAFDPALGGASELWGFGAGPAPAELPDSHEIAAARGAHWQEIVLAADGSSIVQPGGLQLDLSAIAKGYAVDLGIAMLERLGIRHALLEIGGELKGVGVKADGQPWWVDIEPPPHASASKTRIALAGWSIATSGNYRRRREAGEKTWSHSLDPHSATPLDDAVLSVSVLHKDCMRADAYSTAILVMGPGKGTEFADANAIPARIITTGGACESAAWQSWLG